MSRRAARTAPGAFHADEGGYLAAREGVRQREAEALRRIAQVATKYPRPVTALYKDERRAAFEARAEANDAAFGIAILELYVEKKILNPPTIEQCDAVIAAMHNVGRFDNVHSYEEKRLLDIKGMIGAVMRRNYVEFQTTEQFEDAVKSPVDVLYDSVRIVAESSGKEIDGIADAIKVKKRNVILALKVYWSHTGNPRLDEAYEGRLASKISPPDPDKADATGVLETCDLHGGEYCWLVAMAIMLRAVIPDFTKLVRSDAYDLGDPQSIEISKAIDHLCVYKRLGPLVRAFGYKSTDERDEVELFKRFAARFPSLQLGTRYKLAEKPSVGFAAAYVRIEDYSRAILINDKGAYVSVCERTEPFDAAALEPSYTDCEARFFLVDAAGESQSKRSRTSM